MSDRLRCAVVALAAPAPEAGASKIVAGFAENLVVEFDEAYTAFVESFQELPGEPQLLALQGIDSHLAAMVSAREATLWSEAGWRSHPDWVEARRLADRAIEVFGWAELVH